MFIDSTSGKLVNIDARFTTPEGTTYGNLRNPEDRVTVGVVEIDEDPMPEDFSDETHFRTEDWEATQRPYICYPRKPDEMIAATQRAKVQAQIDALEGSNPMARATREFMILTMEKEAVAAGFTVEDLRANHFGYRKVKELDEQIADLRGQIALLGG